MYYGRNLLIFRDICNGIDMRVMKHLQFMQITLSDKNECLFFEVTL